VSGKVLYANIAKVVALDPSTVQFTLKKPDPTFCGSSIYTMSGNILSRRKEATTAQARHRVRRHEAWQLQLVAHEPDTQAFR
jgi:ABC-type transport system substrate-binding protein